MGVGVGGGEEGWSGGGRGASYEGMNSLMRRCSERKVGDATAVYR